MRMRCLGGHRQMVGMPGIENRAGVLRLHGMRFLAAAHSAKVRKKSGMRVHRPFIIICLELLPHFSRLLPPDNPQIMLTFVEISN